MCDQYKASGTIAWMVTDSDQELKAYSDLLYFESIRMNILMLDTRNVEQTKDVRMYT